MENNDGLNVPNSLSPEQLKAIGGISAIHESNESGLPNVPDNIGDLAVDEPLSDVPIEQALMPENISSDASNVLGVNVETKNPIVRPKSPSDPFIKMPPRSDRPALSKPASVEELLAQIAKTSDFQPFDLPSRGLLDESEPRLASGSILIRPMRASEEEILATGRLFKNGEGLEMIFRRCIMFGDRSPLQDPLQLLSLDRIAILIAIRIMTYGPQYDFSIVCGNCRKSFESVVDLDSDLNMYCLDSSMGIKEPMRSVFPECGLEFEYRLSRGYDEQENIKYSRERERKYGGKATDDSFIERAKRQVLSIGGFKDREAISKALSMIKGSDLHHLRQAIDNPAFGVDTRIVLDCPYCLSENRLRLPLGADFFIPRLQETTESSSE